MPGRIQAQEIGTAAATDLTINPTGDLILSSVDATNSGATPLAVDVSGAVQPYLLNDLDLAPTLQDEDMLMVQLNADGSTKKINRGGLTIDWTQIDNVPSGSGLPAAPQDGKFYARSDNSGSYGTGDSTTRWVEVIPYDISKLPTLP